MARLSDIKTNEITEDLGVSGGAKPVANSSALPTGGNSVGDFKITNDNKALHVWNGTKWERIQHGINVSPRFVTLPPSTLFLSASGSTSTITAEAVDEAGFPVTYDWDGFSDSTVYTASSLPNQITNVTESDGVFTLTPSTNTSHAGAFTFRTKASDGAQVSLATTTVNLSFSTDITTSTASGFNSNGTNSYDFTVAQTNNSGSVLSSTLAQGKKYLEIVRGSNITNYMFVGLCDATLTTGVGYNDTGTYSIYTYDSRINPGSNTTGVQNSRNTGDIIMIAYDTSSREVWFGVNGDWYEDPSTTSSSFTVGTSSTTEFKLMFGQGESISRTNEGTINVGSNVVYPVPSGFNAH